MGKEVIRQNLGVVTAYGFAKSKGYTGTAEDFANDQAHFAENAQAVAEDKTAAQAAATEADESREDAAEKAILSESWAHGGTGKREGEDTNNAEYFARVAEAHSNIDTMTNEKIGIGKPDAVTTKVDNGTFSAVGVMVQAYIRSGGTTFSADWLSLTSGGAALIPDGKQAYWIKTDDDEYRDKIYFWDGTMYKPLTTGDGMNISLGDVSGATATTFGTSATIKWSDPSDVSIDGVVLARWGGTVLVRKAGAAPTDRRDGTVVCTNTTRNQYASSGFEDTGLSYGTTYYYRFFPFTETYKYTAGSSVSVTPERVRIENTPSVLEDLVYDGYEQTVSITNLDLTKMTVSGNTGTYAGSYTAVVTPAEGYCWTDGTYAPLNLSWEIEPEIVNVPVKSDAFVFDGTEKTCVESYDTNVISMSGTNQASAAGQYNITLSLIDDDNYIWEDGTNVPKTFTWRIYAEALTVPSITPGLVYTGSEQTAQISTYDTTKISVSGAAGTNAGTYTAVFHIIDTANYCWSDDSITDKSVEWSIGKAPLTVPTVSGNLVYDGTEQSVTVSSYDTTLIQEAGTSGTNAGDYTAMFDLIDTANYEWDDTTQSQKTRAWSIARAAGSIILSEDAVSLDPTNLTATITAAATGTISVSSSDDTVATAAVSGNQITISSVNNTNGTATITVNAAQSANYEATDQTTQETIQVTCAFRTVYGAEWDGTSTTAWSRTDDAADFVDPVPAVGNGDGSSPFDNILPWSGMEIVDDAEAGKLVKIPKYYYKWTRSGSIMKLQISSTAGDGFLVSPAHADRGDGKGERDYVYVGRYHCSSANYKSATGVAPKANATRADFRTSIHTLGSTIWQYDYAMYWTIMMLYLVEYADWNSQAKIGYGCGNNSAAENAGLTDAMVYHTGTNAASRTTYGHTQYRHIEDLWGNVYDWCDGIYFSSANVYCIKNPASFSDNSGGTLVGQRATSGNYIKGWTNPTASGFEYALYPSEVGGTEATYVCDYCDYSSSGVVLLVGGYYLQYQYYGAFYLVGDNAASYKSSSIGSRLQKLP